MVVKRFEVYLVNLDPTIGNETKKTRPCLIVSIVLDQIRTVDKTRLARRLGRIDPQAQTAVLSALAEMFAP
jgi:mRNA interferase MazF